MSDSQHTNALADERSPYLLQHAGNPVDWMPWSDKAIRRARENNQPIFLSIGYSTCHWCHVMEHESFENEAIAALMNEHFVNIKVDREERPDLDATYMAFVQATTGSGGWPMSVWLTPDLKPILGGTYFPPTDRGGRAGFPRIIERVAELWKDDRQRLLDQSEKIVTQLQEGLTAAGGVDQDLPDVTEVAALAASQFSSRYDTHLGGFGGAPKFPRPAALELLLRLRRHMPDDQTTRAEEMAVNTLIQMARGGMHDHVGGGFHRYSVDGFWHVPHFEKMLYDQGQLATSYLEAYQLTGRQELAAAARDIFDYVLRDLLSDQGAFYSAEDADSVIPGSEPGEKREGAFYVWTTAELAEILSEKEAQVIAGLYGVKAAGNARQEGDPMGEFQGQNILYRALPVSKVAEDLELDPATVAEIRDSALASLKKARDLRPRPHLDDKILSGWNGLMISALALGSRVLGDSDLLTAATRAATFLRDEMVDPDSSDLIRSYRRGPSEIPGFAADYAMVIQAFLDLFEAGGGNQWLKLAVRLQGRLDQHYLDESTGAYLTARAGQADAILSITEDYDGAEPSPNSVAALNLIRLGQIQHKEELVEQCRGVLRALSPTLEKAPFSCPKLAVALDRAQAKETRILIGGGADDDALYREVSRLFLPYANIIPVDSETASVLPGDPTIEAFAAICADATTVQICHATSCGAPTQDLAEIKSQLEAGLGKV